MSAVENVVPLNASAPRGLGDTAGIPEPVGDRLLLTVPATARILSLGTTSVYDLIRRGELRSVKIGRSTRVPAACVREYVSRISGQVSP